MLIQQTTNLEKVKQKAEGKISPLGNFVSLCKRKNKNLESTKLVGVSSDKKIINSSWAEKKTNLSVCFLISYGQFVTSLTAMEQTKRLPIGLYKEGFLGVVSSRYRVFEVTNPNLLSEYLKLIFKKELTELWLLYMYFGGIRGELSWKDFVKFPISVTPLEAQKKVVNKYETLERVIQLRKKINKNLERWIQCLFHVIFDNLEEFTNEAFGSLFQISKGGRPPVSNKYLEELYFCQEGGIPFLQVKDISKSKCKFLTFTSEQLTEEGFNKCRGIFLGGGTSFFVITELKKQLKI